MHEKYPGIQKFSTTGKKFHKTSENPYFSILQLRISYYSWPWKWKVEFHTFPGIQYWVRTLITPRYGYSSNYIYMENKSKYSNNVLTSSVFPLNISPYDEYLYGCCWFILNPKLFALQCNPPLLPDDEDIDKLSDSLGLTFLKTRNIIFL